MLLHNDVIENFKIKKLLVKGNIHKGRQSVFGFSDILTYLSLQVFLNVKYLPILKTYLLHGRFLIFTEDTTLFVCSTFIVQ